MAPVSNRRRKTNLRMHADFLTTKLSRDISPRSPVTQLWRNFTKLMASMGKELRGMVVYVGVWDAISLVSVESVGGAVRTIVSLDCGSKHKVARTVMTFIKLMGSMEREQRGTVVNVME